MGQVSSVAEKIGMKAETPAQVDTPGRQIDEGQVRFGE